ncbi:histidine kinase [Mucilaginibacter sp. ZT4R22]|uniref:Histidine kinase n=1 Tax=Mucilaginibacter pankratovii TaxID=2772110 RepID=A0ABR7WJU0_9SPHI|nr:histidine kinase [Mucilaginibacter pankratovii]MBD1362588.1 histidine kinase [Mucilaginibacter pankratovii]
MKEYAETSNNEQVIYLLIDKRYRLVRHTVFIIGLLLFVLGSKRLNDYSGLARYGRMMSVYLGFLAMFYINMYVLIPKFFFKAKYVLYLLLLIVMVITGLGFISLVMNKFFGDPVVAANNKDDMGFYSGTLVSAAIILVTTSMKLFVRWIKDHKRMTELKNLTLSMELNELKNQINPHFLFNMLNNVKALIRIDPEKATMVIMKLSEFLRYQLYENGDQKTSLKSELDFLSNLAELENIRRDKLTITIEVAIHPERLKTIFLPPNLFTTFLENAIKYSVDIAEKPEYIRLDISVSAENLNFRCVNSRAADIWKGDRQNSGLGLPNIKRRLELLYQENFRLKTSSTNEAYFVDLTIPL